MSERGVLILPLVKVKDKFQITIPAKVREEMQIAVGDLLEATIEGQTIVLKPKAVVDRAEAWERVLNAMERVHAKQLPSKKSPKEEEEWIARQVKAYRKQHAKQRH
jgi:AbrB family looped-hinge helix DNA binding protein